MTHYSKVEIFKDELLFHGTFHSLKFAAHTWNAAYHFKVHAQIPNYVLAAHTRNTAYHFPFFLCPVSVHSRSSFISVWGNRLSGALPSTLWTITSLTSLDLSTNLFQSSIPSLIGSLTQLRVFSVLLNSLGGTIPSSLCSIILDISSLRCQFIDWFSSFLCRLALATIVLTLLALGTNSFISSIPSSMGSLSRLSYLQMSFNRLTGTVPPTVGCLTRLTWIGGANHASN